jgi:polyisoprenoid-binding protein YceI
MKATKLSLTLLPVALVGGLAAYVAFHPGVAYAEPRLAAGSPAPFTQAATYTIDPLHTSISFEITHLGLAQVHGRFNKFSGKIREDAKQLGNSGVEFTIQVDSVDTAIPARDAHLRNADFFDVAKYPEITFKSTKIAKVRNGYVATGDLTMHGKTKSIRIPFKHYGPHTLKGMGDQPTRIGIVAEPITIKRSDFGLGSTKPLPDGTVGVSDEVLVRLSLEATLDK